MVVVVVVVVVVVAVEQQECFRGLDGVSGWNRLAQAGPQPRPRAGGGIGSAEPASKYMRVNKCCAVSLPGRHAAELEEAGADQVVIRSVEAGLALGSQLLGALGASEIDVSYLKRGIEDSIEARWGLRGTGGGGSRGAHGWGASRTASRPGGAMVQGAGATCGGVVGESWSTRRDGRDVRAVPAWPCGCKGPVLQIWLGGFRMGRWGGACYVGQRWGQ